MAAKMSAPIFAFVCFFTAVSGTAAYHNFEIRNDIVGKCSFTHYKGEHYKFGGPDFNGDCSHSLIFESYSRSQKRVRSAHVRVVNGKILDLAADRVIQMDLLMIESTLLIFQFKKTIFFLEFSDRQ